MPSESQASPACSSEGSRDSYWSIRILLNWGSMSVAQSCPTLPPHGQGPARLLPPWYFPGKNSGVGCHFLLQRFFLTQRSNLGLPHCQQTLYCSEPLGKTELGELKLKPLCSGSLGIANILCKICLSEIIIMIIDFTDSKIICLLQGIRKIRRLVPFVISSRDKHYFGSNNGFE